MAENIDGIIKNLDSDDVTVARDGLYRAICYANDVGWITLEDFQFAISWVQLNAQLDAAMFLVPGAKFSNRAAFIHAFTHQTEVRGIPDELLPYRLAKAALLARTDQTQR